MADIPHPIRRLDIFFINVDSPVYKKSIDIYATGGYIRFYIAIRHIIFIVYL